MYKLACAPRVVVLIGVLLIGVVLFVVRLCLQIIEHHNIATQASSPPLSIETVLARFLSQYELLERDLALGYASTPPIYCYRIYTVASNKEVIVMLQ